MNKVFLDYQGPTIKIDGICYVYDGTSGAPINADPSEIGGVFDDCEECLLESSSSTSESSESSSSEGYSESSSSSEGYSESSSSSEGYSESSSSSEGYSSDSSSSEGYSSDSSESSSSVPD